MLPPTYTARFGPINHAHAKAVPLWHSIVPVYALLTTFLHERYGSQLRTRCDGQDSHVVGCARRTHQTWFRGRVPRGLDQFRGSQISVPTASEPRLVNDLLYRTSIGNFVCSPIRLSCSSPLSSSFRYPSQPRPDTPTSSLGHPQLGRLPRRARLRSDPSFCNACHWRTCVASVIYLKPVSATLSSPPPSGATAIKLHPPLLFQHCARLLCCWPPLSRREEASAQHARVAGKGPLPHAAGPPCPIGDRCAANNSCAAFQRYETGPIDGPRWSP
jgi:hypothetical protein